MEDRRFYLYGAAIQGIQSFILQSDELKDIVGASELIEEICTKSFDEFGKNPEGFVVKAAGNIKYIFDNKEECERAFLKFPKKVMETAPGITVSQAVVTYKSEKDFCDAIDMLEVKLKAQRNRQISIEPCLMSMRRSRQTGLPVIKLDDGEFLDAGTVAKRVNAKKGSDNSVMKLSEECFGITRLNHDKIAYDIEKITYKNNWIAIIHADGNGLGQVVQKLGKDRELFSSFSKKLDEATKAAAQSAYKIIAKKYHFDKLKKIPIRPVVLGGDDLTIICRGDFAVEYTLEFLKAFEQKTEELLGDMLSAKRVFKNGEKKLTACAGIAFIKSSYPFYYGYQLADDLCKAAKKDAKQDKASDELAPSCLMFHKVQDSFVTDYKEIVKRELTPVEDITFENGPYYLNTTAGRWTSKELLDKVELLGGDEDKQSKEANAVKSHLRQWLTDMYYDQGLAEQKLKRLKSGIKNYELRKLVDISTTGNRIAAYDVLSLVSIMFNQTIKEEQK
jgi:hypothetical protein